MFDLKIEHSKPPIWDRCAQVFGEENVQMDKGVVFTYGDTIYAAEKPTDDVMFHEMVHMRQQSQHPGQETSWWERYLTEIPFRLSQELEAYQEQYKFIKTYVKDRNALYRVLYELAGHLSGPMYGRMINRSDAIKKIRDGNI